MKREYYLILIIFLLVVIYIFIPKDTLKKEDEPKIEEEKRAVFISYIELGNNLRGKSSEEMKHTINDMLDNAKNFGFNMIILQVRSFSDAIYKSSIYPSSRSVVNTEGDDLPFDILDYFVKKAHKKNLELHAWINPYRISNDTDISVISKDNPAYKLLNTDAVKIIDNVGIYYNPASSKVETLILEGIEEIIKSYDVDGIHFDDYFYPKSDDIDKNEYEKSLKDNNLTLQQFRLNTISSLIKKTYKLIKSYDKAIFFGISPDGNIDNNYNSNYVDTRLFCTEKGYLDYIMPQVYYGFLNSTKPFEDTVKSWNNLITNNIELIPALAFYKTGNIDEYAKEGSNEWIEYNNIISREVMLSRELSNYSGFAIFRYDSIFGSNLTSTSFLEKENLKNILS
ncbi:MAG TPA: family 10 glycosylhydrolase [Candidatus Onthousia excrementipullorum]|uniref:Family 10 glycosylhydrolase n=1 Tax=Candidatus Onthousia excrementipullorum TaxID=2840884 RepID=A0A9D1DUY6_9FIRM|nr:family 10 glycosylhydrolase [Candidatus Onthousia excrementipullorum]